MFQLHTVPEQFPFIGCTCKIFTTAQSAVSTVLHRHVTIRLQFPQLSLTAPSVFCGERITGWPK